MPAHVTKKKRRTFEDECDAMYAEQIALDEAERAARIRTYETSPEQADWDSDLEDEEAD